MILFRSLETTLQQKVNLHEAQTNDYQKKINEFEKEVKNIIQLNLLALFNVIVHEVFHGEKFEWMMVKLDPFYDFDNLYAVKYDLDRFIVDLIILLNQYFLYMEIFLVFLDLHSKSL